MGNDIQEGIVEIRNLPIEQELEDAGRATVRQANALEITSQTDYENAAAFLKSIKTQVGRIKEYWSGPKAKAAEAHKDIVAKEKAMLNPLTDAERIVKQSMTAYMDAVKRERERAEEEIKRRQQEEAARLMQQADAAESNGDKRGADITRQVAQNIATAPAASTVATPSAAGIATRVTWKGHIVAQELVPAYFNGAELRTINMAAINAIGRATKGQAQIPGVEFYEEQTIAVR